MLISFYMASKFWTLLNPIWKNIQKNHWKLCWCFQNITRRLHSPLSYDSSISRRLMRQDSSVVQSKSNLNIMTFLESGEIMSSAATYEMEAIKNNQGIFILGCYCVSLILRWYLVEHINSVFCSRSVTTAPFKEFLHYKNTLPVYISWSLTNSSSVLDVSEFHN